MIAAEPNPMRRPATIPIGRVTPSAMPANAPNVTTQRPMNRSGLPMYGDAITTMAVATASLIAR